MAAIAGAMPERAGDARIGRENDSASDGVSPEFRRAPGEPRDCPFGRCAARIRALSSRTTT